MEYNTSREKMFIREYGRHVQRIVAHALTIKDREYRNKFALEIIELMGQLNPQLRNVEDFRHKLWDHLFILSDFKLDVDSPYPIKSREEIEKKPVPLPYPHGKIRYKHYGKNVESLVKKAIETEDPEKRDGFAQCIGNYMKLVYQNSSREFANDHLIMDDLRILSDGQLSLDRDTNLNMLTRGSTSFRQISNTNNNNRGGKPNKFKHKQQGNGGGKPFYKKKNNNK
jgi:hypothetical protein